MKKRKLIEIIIFKDLGKQSNGNFASQFTLNNGKKIRNEVPDNVSPEFRRELDRIALMEKRVSHRAINKILGEMGPVLIPFTDRSIAY